MLLKKHNKRENNGCIKNLLLGKSLVYNFVILTQFAANSAQSQIKNDTSPSLQSGLSFEEAKETISPFTDILAWGFSALASLWQYIMDNAPAAILLSGLIGLAVAMKSISSNREMTRLRETYLAIDRSIKDKDAIEDRRAFRNLQNKLKETKRSIGKYHNPKKEEDVLVASHLNNILRDYENLALGIRYNILDEPYLHRWTRTLVIRDWNSLMPLVTAKRSDGSPNAFIEFEGLASSWQQDESYRTGKKISAAKRNTKVN